MNNNVQIGEYIKIKNPGIQYSTYELAFNYFHVNKAKLTNLYRLNNLKDIIWKVENKAIHSDYDEYIVSYIQSVDKKYQAVVELDDDIHDFNRLPIPKFIEEKIFRLNNKLKLKKIE